MAFGFLILSTRLNLDLSLYSPSYPILAVCILAAVKEQGPTTHGSYPHS
jgi:hypothetical protein